MKAKTVTRIFVAIKLIIAVALIYSIFMNFAHNQFKGDQMQLFSKLLGIIFLLIYCVVLLINAVAELKPAFYSLYLLKYETGFGFLYAVGSLYILLFKCTSIYIAIYVLLVSTMLVVISIRNIYVIKSTQA